MIKRAFALLLLIGLTLTAGWPPMAFAGGSPSVALTIDKPAAAVGAEVKVTVTGSSLTDVYAYEAALRYDDRRLKLRTAVNMADGFSIDPIVKDGTITLAHTKVGKRSGDSGTVVLATLTFVAQAAGPAEISLIRTKLVNAALGESIVKGVSRAKAIIGGGAPLTDIAGHWAEEAIKRAAGLGFVQGYADNRFLPNKPVTRAEFAAMLVRAMNPASMSANAPAFKDATAIPAWAKDAATTAIRAGWITGYEDLTFRAGKPITRAELAAMAVRAMGWQPEAASKPDFADSDAIAPWARPYAALSAERKLMGGRGQQRFAPNEPTTRAEAAAILVRMYDAKMNEGGLTK